MFKQAQAKQSHIRSLLGSWWERAKEIYIMVVVQTILALVWAAMLALMMVGVIFPVWGITADCVDRAAAAAAFMRQSPSTGALAGVVWLLCALPYPLSLCAALVVRQRAAGRKLYRFVPGTKPELEGRNELLDRVENQWELEAARARDGVQRVLLYAGFLGCITSVALCLCAILLPGHLEPVTATRTSLPLTVTAAVCASFAMGIGRIVVRTAQHDFSGKMFAWATRSLLLSILGAMLFVLLLAQSTEAPVVSSTGGFITVGIAVALLGEQFLQTITERAAKMLGVAVPIKSSSGADIGQLNGLSEEDIVRLAEEGIDTIHALAFVPTPRLYFSTTYSLQRICNWQDQAMLIVATDSKAPTFRQQMMVHGAMDAQVLAERFLKPALNESAPTGFTQKELDELSTRLGFGTTALARVGLHALAEDEVTRRLRVYNHGTVERIPARKERSAADATQPALAANHALAPAGG